MIRVGIIGCGSVAGFGHAPAIHRTSGVELAAAYDPVPGKAQEFTQRNGGQPFDDLDAFFAHPLDAVSICSPVGVHHDNVLRAAAAKVHVLCEKPVTTTREHAEEMCRAMSFADRLLMVGLVYRFSHAAQDIRRWVREGVIGEVRSLRLVYLWNLHGQWMNDGSGKWIESPLWRGRMLEGGPMVDCGVHQIDLARWWLGSEVVRIHGAGAWVSNYEAPDHVYAHLDHESGAHTMVDMSFTYGHTAKEPTSTFTYELIGTGGVIRYNREGWKLEILDGSNTRAVPGASEKNFEGMYEAWRDAIQTGSIGDLPDVEAGMRAMEIAQEATRQAIEQRVAPSHPATIVG
ncbi:MviM Predicted dehydrogenases and related proteins [Fimbriimonadaceae bacterium]